MLASLFLTACAPPVHKQQSYVFGTLVEVTLYGVEPEKARRVTDAVLRDFDQLHHALHAWEPGPLERLNARFAQARPGRPARADLPPGLAPILEDATRLSAQSEGLFNPAIGNLVRLWGFHADSFEARLPNAGAIRRLVAARPGMGDLKLDGGTVTCRNPALRLDLGGYKGHALDRAAALLKRAGVDNALINIGGNILALGSKGGARWKVGIQHPRRAGALAVLELDDGEAIGTSGDYQRFFELDGVRHSHLIDPRTGWPARAAQAATVLARGARAGTLSDVATKPLFIGGPREWRRLAARMGVTQALFVAADGEVAVTRALAARLAWVAPAPRLRVVE